MSTGGGGVVHEGPNLTVETRGEQAQVTVAVRGVVDVAAVPLLRVVLDAVLARRPERVVIDVAGMAFIDSAGLLTLVAARRRLAARRAVLVLRDPRSSVCQVLEAAGLDRAFTIVYDQCEQPVRPRQRGWSHLRLAEGRRAPL